MRTKDHARELRASGLTFARIGRTLGIHPGHAHWCARDIARGEPQPTAKTVVRHHAYNGGCSTQSGMMAISMPRIEALHGRAA